MNEAEKKQAAETMTREEYLESRNKILRGLLELEATCLDNLKNRNDIDSAKALNQLEQIQRMLKNLIPEIGALQGKRK